MNTLYLVGTVVVCLMIGWTLGAIVRDLDADAVIKNLSDENDILRAELQASDDIIAHFLGDKRDVWARMGTYSAGADVDAQLIVDSYLLGQGRANV